ncbi:MAG: ABC transporter permease [Acidobacteriaceae bacterium]|nr:ABC transporter permease [Acidobacteriaceae bacterium]MBV9674993.1 ABC transporter permease [Acidobacteriaceae bacterium]
MMKLRLSREGLLIVVMLVLIAVNSVLFPAAFPTLSNASAVLRGLASDGIMACGMMLLLIAGTFDLSVGGTFSMTGVVAGWLMKSVGVPVPLAVVLALLTGAAAGFLNGIIVARVRVNALIATLGTMGVYRGIAVLIGGPGISFLPPSFAKPGQTAFLGLQGPVWLMIIIAVLFSVLLWRTRFFRQYYFIGNNAAAARLSGIDVPTLQILAFTIMGLLAGLAGLAFASRVGTSVSVAGDGAELRVITAAILGGASLTGGKGTVWGALIGVGFVALINNALIIGSVSSYWQSIITGIVLVLAVAMDRFMKSERGREA